MISYKLVPVEPTDDFVVLGGERIADHIRCEFGSNGFTAEEAQGIFENAYRTIVEEGPAMQGEPVGWQFYQDGKWWYGDDRIKDHRKNTEEAGFRVRDVYATPQPTVQGEPVDRQSPKWPDADAIIQMAYEEGQLSEDGGGYLFTFEEFGLFLDRLLYTAPQPEERQPSADDSLTSVPDEVFAAEFAAWWDEQGQFCRAGGGTYEQSFAFEAWRHLYPQLMNLQMAEAEQQPEPISRNLRAVHAMIFSALDRDAADGKAVRGEMAAELRSALSEKQPAPDASGLVEALESLIKGYVSLLEGGIDRITSLSGDCDSIPDMLRDARAAIAAHRKGAES